MTGNLGEMTKQTLEEAIRKELKSRLASMPGVRVPLTGKEAAQLRALGVKTSRMCVALTEKEATQLASLGVTIRPGPAQKAEVHYGPGTPIKFLAARSSPFRSR